MALESIYNQLGIPIWTLVLITIWEGIWTAIAMWKSARKGHTLWFIIFFLVNLLAIPEIIYLIVMRKKKSRKAKKK